MSEPSKSSENPSKTPAAAPQQAFDRFEDLPIEPVVLKGIQSFGFEHPTPIQRRAIGPLAIGRDARRGVGHAQRAQRRGSRRAGAPRAHLDGVDMCEEEADLG